MNFPSLCSIQGNHFAIFHLCDNSWRRALAAPLHRDLHKEQQSQLRQLPLALWQTKAVSNKRHRDTRSEEMALCALSGKWEHSPCCGRMEHCAGGFLQHSYTSKIILLQFITSCPSPFLCPDSLLLGENLKQRKSLNTLKNYCPFFSSTSLKVHWFVHFLPENIFSWWFFFTFLSFYFVPYSGVISATLSKWSCGGLSIIHHLILWSVWFIICVGRVASSTLYSFLWGKKPKTSSICYAFLPSVCNYK